MTLPIGDRSAIVQAMKKGGYFQRIMAAGAELDRVKGYLQSLTGRMPRPTRCSIPTIPCFRACAIALSMTAPTTRGRVFWSATWR